MILFSITTLPLIITLFCKLHSSLQFITISVTYTGIFIFFFCLFTFFCFVFLVCYEVCIKLLTSSLCFFHVSVNLPLVPTISFTKHNPYINFSSTHFNWFVIVLPYLLHRVYLTKRFVKSFLF